MPQRTIWVLILASGITAWMSTRLPAHKSLPPIGASSAGSEGVGKEGTLPAAQTRSVTEDWPQVSVTDSDSELLPLVQMMVARSPREALAWAASQSNVLLKQRLRQMILGAWGELDPRAAVGWAQGQDVASRESDMKVVLSGAIAQPGLAMAMANELLSQDRDSGGVYATMLAQAFVVKGKFSDAMRFINQSPADAMADPVNAVFRGWAQSQPQDALAGVNSITNPQLRQSAFGTAVATWNASDPAGLAAYANVMAPGSDRDYALSAAIDNWSLQDPAALSTWLNTLPRGDEYDFGTAMMIARTDAANLPPAQAMQWVANINDPALRQDSLNCVLGEWRQSDPAAAQQYVAGVSWLNDSQRQAALTYLAAAP